ncbi:MAG: PTPDL family protein [Verrucomicrobiales bacterium]
MKLKHLPLIGLSCLFSLSQAGADTIVLQDGSKLDGKVVEENADNIVVEINVSASIKDRRTFKRSEIKDIIAISPDQKPFEDLQNLVPTPDGLPASDYQSRIESARAFIKSYPSSKHIPAVREIIATLEEELKKAESGALKIVGKWITPEQQKSNAYEIDASLAFDRMKKNIAEGQLREAILAYEDLRTKTPGTIYQAQADELAVKLLAAYHQQLTKQIEQAPDLVAKREQTIANVDAGTATRMKDEIARTQEIYRAAVEKAEEENQKWLPTSPYHEDELEDVARHAESTLKSLQTQLERDAEEEDKEKVDLGEAYRKAWAALEANNQEQGKELVNAFRSSRVKPGAAYVETLESKLAGIDAAIKAAAARKAAEEKAKAEAMAAEKEAGETPDSEEAMPQINGVPSGAGDKAEEAGAEKSIPATKNIPADKNNTKNKKPEKPAATEESELVEDELLEEEEGGMMMTILYGVIGLALIVLLVVLLSSGKKKK